MSRGEEEEEEEEEEEDGDDNNDAEVDMGVTWRVLWLGPRDNSGGSGDGSATCWKRRLREAC